MEELQVASWATCYTTPELLLLCLLGPYGPRSNPSIHEWDLREKRTDSNNKTAYSGLEARDTVCTVLLWELSLREIPYLPCAILFAVCLMSGTWQKGYSPCATYKAHGKHWAHGEQNFCRVQLKKHTVNFNHTTKFWIPLHLSLICRVLTD